MPKFEIYSVTLILRTYCKTIEFLNFLSKKNSPFIYYFSILFSKKVFFPFHLEKCIFNLILSVKNLIHIFTQSLIIEITYYNASKSCAFIKLYVYVNFLQETALTLLTKIRILCLGVREGHMFE